MKKLGIILLIYNVILKLFCDADWYYYAYPYIDAIDTIFYIFALIVFFKFWKHDFKKITNFEKYCFIASFLLIALKVGYNELKFSYATYTFYFWLLIVAPILLEIERNYNDEQRTIR